MYVLFVFEPQGDAVIKDSKCVAKLTGPAVSPLANSSETNPNTDRLSA